ncbi:MAG: ROK family protein [Saccharofermentanales bacterium]|jgi:predicted NBD/HSP70 family sugar kinase
MREKVSIVQNRKRNQRNKIISLIFQETDVSRNDLRRKTSYSMTTITNTVSELIEEGLIYEEESDISQVGRRPVWLRINPDGAYFIGVEFNARALHVCVLDLSGKTVFLRKQDIKYFIEADEVIKLIVEHVEEAINFLKEKEKKIAGVGVGIPGYLDTEEGIAKSYNLFKNWENISVKEILEKKVQKKVYVENNVNNMVYAYKWLYREYAEQDFVFISMRTGIRMVPVIDERVVIAKSGSFGELGHIKLGQNNRICSCGDLGCLNAEISEIAIENRIKEGINLGRFAEIAKLAEEKSESVSIKHFIESVHAGDRDSLILVNDIINTLSKIVAIVVNIFAPRKIILYGNLVKLGSTFLEELQAKARDSIVYFNKDIFKIEAAKGGDELGAIGAASRVMQKEFEFIKSRI